MTSAVTRRTDRAERVRSLTSLSEMRLRIRDKSTAAAMLGLGRMGMSSSDPVPDCRTSSAASFSMSGDVPTIASTFWRASARFDGHQRGQQRLCLLGGEPGQLDDFEIRDLRADARGQHDAEA